MINRKLLAKYTIAAFAALAPGCGPVSAQESAAPSPDLGARIVLRNGIRQYLAGDGVLYSYTPDSLRTASSASDRTAAAVKVSSRSSSNSLRLEVSALFGPVVTNKIPDWSNDFAEQTGPSYALRDGDTVVVTDLLKYGLSLLNLQAAPAKPVRLLLGTDFDTVYYTPALDILGVDESLNRFKISVSNRASKPVAAYALGNGHAHAVASLVTDFAWLEDDRKLPPGATYSAEYDSEQAGWRAYPASARRPKLVVAAVLFQDGSSEGDATSSSGLTDSRKGQRDQLARVLDILNSVEPSTDEDVAAAIKKLKAQISGLPELSTHLEASASDLVYRAGQQAIKAVALTDLEELEAAPRQYYGTGYLKNRLVAIRDHYSKVQARL